VVDPQTTWVEVGVSLATDVTLLPNVYLRGATSVASFAVIGPNVSLTDCVVAQSAQILNATCVEAQIGEAAQVGPYTFLRPGTVLRAGSRAGGFVEMKNADLGEGSKVPHLSYVGDATVGEHTNIGAATVFVNYDGVEKHHTVVGSHVRIGSDTMLVAPVSVGDGAYTAAGSVITDDVPPGAIGVGRARQRTIKDWVLRRRSGSASARAALDAKEAEEVKGSKGAAGAGAERHDGAGNDGVTPGTDADAGAREGGHGQ
jgi:bifunctional UDP-N-acetylglucosamine pyrophosphorylase/glucosamine-1-phosphate N-acetyltransferase